MKKIALTILMGCLVLSANGQTPGPGTVNFSNEAFVLFVDSLDEPLFDTDGTTILTDSSFTIGLYGGVPGGSLALLATTALGSGTAPAYFNGGSVDVDGVSAQQKAHIQIKAYNGSSFESSTVRGESSIFSVNTGGKLDMGSPAALPGNFFASNDPDFGTGFVGFQVMNVVPEPSTVALGVIGGLGMLLRRRKN